MPVSVSGPGQSDGHHIYNSIFSPNDFNLVRFFFPSLVHFHCLCDGIVIEYNVFAHAINSGNGMEHTDLSIFHISYT